MAGSRRILVIAKRPMLERLAAGEVERLAASGAVDRDHLHASAVHHVAGLGAVRAALAGHQVRERSIADVEPTDADDRELVVTVGGDGTVLTANTLRAARPLITVNSDPSTSIGHYTRCRAEAFAALFAGWLAGNTRLEMIPRLRVTCDGGASFQPILNDCLFTNRNPAAMSRYLLETGGDRESQRSSGVWIATAAGSTGGIRSAGAAPLPPHTAALLFKVREPFQGRQPARLLEGRQVPPAGLRLTAAMPNLELYVDGPYRRQSLPPGSTAEFSACAEPLRLVVG